MDSRNWFFSEVYELGLSHTTPWSRPVRCQLKPYGKTGGGRLREGDGGNRIEHAFMERGNMPNIQQGPDFGLVTVDFLDSTDPVRHVKGQR